jgi:hypothetical protein
MMTLMAHAQQQEAAPSTFTPQKGDFTVAATLEYNSYASVTALSGLLTDYEAAALPTSWADKKLMVGLEGGWFVNDLWKLNLGGGLSFTNNPGYPAVTGTIDSSSQATKDAATGSASAAEANMGEIPNYRAVANAQRFDYRLFTGVDRYFKIAKTPNLMPYVGARVGFVYSMNEMRYDEYETMGSSVAEGFNLQGALVAGADYFVAPGMYVGAQVSALSCIYNLTSYRPQEGLASLQADSFTYGVLAAPTIKIGFKF